MKSLLFGSLMLGLGLTTTLGSARALAADRYLIVAPHKAEDCLAVLDDIAAQDKKLLGKMEWGCMANDHTGYVILEGASEEEVRSKLPEKMRASAKIQKLNKFTLNEIRSFHAKQ